MLILKRRCKMALIDKVPAITEYVKKLKPTLKHNSDLFEILEGNINKFIRKELEDQLSPKAAAEALERSAPINVLRKVNDKLSKIYTTPVLRNVPNSLVDNELVSLYEQDGINEYLGDSNFNFNSYKYSGVEPYFDADEKKISMRVVPSHLFLAYGDNPRNPIEMTVWIKLFDEKMHLYSSDEFLSVTYDGKIVTEDVGDTEWLNQYGVIPFGYVSRSKYLIVPMPDSDSKKMAVLLPVLISDLNFSAKYLSHPIIYGINVESDNLQRSPNVFWQLATTDDGKNPSVGSITPQADLAGIMDSIKEQLAMWLETKNIKASTIGISTADNAASGIALMIRNIDTSEDRKQQTSFFTNFEKRLWYKIAKIHNYHAARGELIDNRQFTESIRDIEIVFGDQSPLEDPTTKVERLKIQVESKFMSRKEAMRELYPDKSEEAIEEMVMEIDQDSQVKMPVIVEAMNGETTEGGNSDPEGQQV
jgi:hypothetical protein